MLSTFQAPPGTSSATSLNTTEYVERLNAAQIEPASQASARAFQTAIENPYYVVEQKYLTLEGGKLRLKLLQQIRLRFNIDDFTFRVIDWDEQIAAVDLNRLPAVLSRKFLQLYSRAETNSLSDEQRSQFLKISDYVDSSYLNVERAAPRYIEASIISVEESILVEWHGIHREWVAYPLAHSLSELRKNDRFSAWVRLGLDDRIFSIERVLLLPPPTTRDIRVSSFS